MPKYRPANQLSDTEYEDALGSYMDCRESFFLAKRAVAECEKCKASGFIDAFPRYAEEVKYDTVTPCSCMKAWAVEGKQLVGVATRLDRLDELEDWMFSMPHPPKAEPVSDEKWAMYQRKMANLFSGFGSTDLEDV